MPVVAPANLRSSPARLRPGPAAAPTSSPRCRSTPAGHVHRCAGDDLLGQLHLCFSRLPYDVRAPLPAGRPRSSADARARSIGPPGADQVDVLAAIRVIDERTLASSNEARRPTSRLERPGPANSPLPASPAPRGGTAPRSAVHPPGMSRAPLSQPSLSVCAAASPTLPGGVSGQPRLTLPAGRTHRSSASVDPQARADRNHAGEVREVVRRG